MNRDVRKLEEIIRSKLATEYERLKVVNVRVHEDADFEDDDFIYVDVVFEGPLQDTDAGALSGVVRKVRPALFENDESAFPVFSFISKDDAGLASRAAARFH